MPNQTAAARGMALGVSALRSFDYQHVRLLPGRMAAQVTQAREVYGGIDNDSLLKGFRAQAGLAAPGAPLRGWCATTSAVIFGQLLSGMTRLGRATGDQTLSDKAVALFRGWLATLPPDGCVRMRLYDWDKLVCGLVDLHQYLGVAEALPALRCTVDWAQRTFDRTRSPADDHDFWGAGPGDTSEWYTLPENLYRAYLASGDSVYRDFAAIWHYEDYWQAFASNDAPAVVHAVHAYSHVNSFSSAAAAYLVTGDTHYLRICENGFSFLQRTQLYATGGYGPDERLMRPDGSLGRSLECCGYHAEIPCGSWAAFKLSRSLMCFTGAAHYGDWIETLLFNGLFAGLAPMPDGRAFYYGDYRLSGGTKQRYWQEWPCCSGTWLQLMAEYHNLIWFEDDGGVYVNLYAPAELSWRHADVTVTLRQQTEYPESEDVVLAIEPEQPVQFALRLRIPGWTQGARLWLGDAPLDVPAVPGQWAVVEREWRAGDRLTLRLPMALRTQPIDPQHLARVAILYGPVVLAQDEACCRRPFTIAADTSLATRLIREDRALRFRITNAVPERHTRYLVPLYEIAENWPYFVYFDLHGRTLY